MGPSHSDLHLAEVGVCLGLLAGPVVEAVVHQAGGGRVLVVVALAQHVHVVLSVHVHVARTVVLVVLMAAAAVTTVVATVGPRGRQCIVGVVTLK